MRLIKKGDLIIPQNIKDLIDWENKSAEDDIELFTLVETREALKEHIKKSYGNPARTALAWGKTHRAITKIIDEDNPISNHIAPFFNFYRIPDQYEYLKIG